MIKNKMGAFWEIWLLTCLIFVNLRFFSYLQKLAIFMRWVWKIWVDHNKTDCGSIGGISEVTNKLYKIASKLHTEKSFSRANLLHFSYIFLAKLHQNGRNLLARLHGNQISMPKFWHFFFEFLNNRPHLMQISSKSETCRFQVTLMLREGGS